MKQALIVIDVQESFRKRPYWRGDELPAFLANVQSLIDLARTRGIPILQVFHQELTDDASDAFSRSSGLVRAMPELSLRADAVFQCREPLLQHRNGRIGDACINVAGTFQVEQRRGVVGVLKHE